MDDIISEGSHVVLMKSFDSSNMKIVPAIRNTVVHYGKLHFDPSPLIGSKYGSVFEIKEGCMSKVDNFLDYDTELSNKVSNKVITFNEKSQFSKEKLIKKKKRQNHANIVTVIRSSLTLLNDMLYARDKLGGLRIDTLGQILTLANIQNGTRCLLLDHNLGLLTSAVMSRSLPDGICIQLMADYEAICTTRKTLNMLNLGERACSGGLFAITIRDLYKVRTRNDSFEYEDDVMRTRAREHMERLAQIQTRTTRSETNEKILIEPEEVQHGHMQEILTKKDTNRESRCYQRLKAREYLRSFSLDSIILIAQNDHPLPLLKLTYAFLAPSRQFVIYSDTIEPLLECYQYLKSESQAVSMILSESWLRRYQVLPDRTRPEMNVSGYGGYLLSGIKALLKPNGEKVPSASEGQ